MPFVHPLMSFIGYLNLALAAGYSALTLVALVAWRLRRKAAGWAQTAVRCGTGSIMCWVWLQSFFTSQVTWRGATFDVDPDGIMHRLV
jgi:hypothetical protein